MNARWSQWRVDVIGAAALVGVTAGGYLLGIDAMLKKHQSRSDDRVMLDQRRHEADILAAQRGALDRRIERADERIEDEGIRLRPRSALNEILADLTEAASGASLSVDQLQSRAIESGELFDTVPLTLTGRGAYPAVVRFLRELGDRFPDLRVRGLALTREDRDGSVEAAFSLDLAWRAAKVSGD